MIAAVAAIVTAVCALLALVACLLAAQAGVLVIHFRKPPKPRTRTTAPPQETSHG